MSFDTSAWNSFEPPLCSRRVFPCKARNSAGEMWQPRFFIPSSGGVCPARLLLRRGLPTGIWAVGVLLASGFACSLTDDLGARQHPRLPRVVPQFMTLRGGLSSSENGAGEAPQPAPPSAAAGDASGEAVRAEGDGEDDFSLGAVSGGRASEEADGAGQDSSSAADDVTWVPGEGREGPGADAGEDAAGGDDADVVECNFERIGDTNGVFYYLGLQECAEPTDDAVAQALRLAAPAVHRGPGNHAPQRRFRNPALTGRVQVKTPLTNPKP